MIFDRHQGGWIIVLSFVIAMMLMAMPLPDWAIYWRPSWVAIVLIYWCMALPDRVGIGIGWVLGLLLDVQQGTVLGQNALGLAIIAYLCLKSYQRMRVFPLTQQAVLVCIYLLLYEFISLWIRGMMGVPPNNWTYWMPAFTSMLLWPWLFIVLRDIRRKYLIS
ncbi:MAG: rod shape-determining protein MreD [Gammaproteobacteria bacterium RBG_16_51_14]|nr:MAG: rod shape-determining protein MreD [Gammaproteobacteria bacterium RBG_16_51_14]